MPPRTFVRVYAGPGSGETLVAYTLEALRNELSFAVGVCTINAEELLSSPWQANTSAIVLPGGADLPYLATLAGAGTNLLRAFVESGGAYLGMCAGAYFACAHCDFEAGTPQEVRGARPLAFLPGTAVGSVTPDFAYDGGGCALRVLFAAPGVLVSSSPPLCDECLAYVHGGPYFKLDEPEGASVTVLARYADSSTVRGDGEPAAVHIRVGQGHAVLCGPHPEMAPRWARTPGEGAAGTELAAQLEASCEATRRLWRLLLTAVGMSLRPLGLNASSLSRQSSATELGPVRSTSTLDLQTLPDLPLPQLFSAAAPPPPPLHGGSTVGVPFRRLGGWLTACAALAGASPALRQPAPRVARAARVAAGACACAAGASVRLGRPAGGIPITAQTFAACLCGLLLGPHDGVRATSLYALAAAVGAPVLAPSPRNSREGSQLSAGYVAGFSLCAFAVGRSRNRCAERGALPSAFAASAASAAAAGQLAAVLAGGAWASLLLSRAGAETDAPVGTLPPRPWLLELALRSVVPFVPGLLVKAAATGAVALLAAPLLDVAQ